MGVECGMEKVLFEWVMRIRSKEISLRGNRSDEDTWACGDMGLV